MLNVTQKNQNDENTSTLSNTEGDLVVLPVKVLMAMRRDQNVIELKNLEEEWPGWQKLQTSRIPMPPYVIYPNNIVRAFQLVGGKLEGKQLQLENLVRFSIRTGNSGYLDDEGVDGRAKDEEGLSEIDKVPIWQNLTLKSHLKRVFGNSVDDDVDRKIKDEKGLSEADEQPISPNLSFKTHLKERFISQNYPISSQSLIDKISSSDNLRTELDSERFHTSRHGGSIERDYFQNDTSNYLRDVKSKFTSTNRLNKFNHEISSPEQYLECMDSIRESCNLLALVPVYFFTSPFLSSYILSGGFRLNSDDNLSGVIFTTKGPASFGLGSERYEKNVIVALKGASRINDYRGKHKLDVCIVYAVEPRVLQPVMGESEHFRLIPRVFFEAFSDLKDDEETFFLRPDRIMASFLLDPYALQVDDSVEKVKGETINEI